MRTVAIVGVGLIGGSFALALRKAGYRGGIIGVSSPRTVAAALARGVIDEGLTLEAAVSRADLVFLSQPISGIIATLGRLDPLLAPGALVTDAGSTKARIVETGRRAISRGQFLGGHPMAGKETRGVEESDPDLFAGRTWALTPPEPAEMETPAAKNFTEWIVRIGALPVVLPPAEHDRVVAFTSHLPQLASTALATTVAQHVEDAARLRVAGPGLAGMIRLASSAYDIWGDILTTNSAEIEAALDAYIARLEDLRARLTDPGMRETFDAAARAAALRGREPVN